MEKHIHNPFAVQTPEDIPAKDVCELFVDVFTDFPHILHPGHTFLNGPRGSGKSMMFRFMQPDCQSYDIKKDINEHHYFAIYIPIKKTNLDVIDLQRLKRHANLLLNEHLMATHIAALSFKSFVNKITIQITDDILNEVRAYYKDCFRPTIIRSGWDEIAADFKDEDNFESIFSKMGDMCDKLYVTAMRYVKSLAFTSEITPYSGALCGYMDFLYPLLLQLKKLSFMPVKPLYLLIDDADNLNEAQTTILNTWVSYRTSTEVSLKISTQLNYKTYRTVSGSPIDTPHDYSEINIGTVYTSSKDKYRERVAAIVEKRLLSAGIHQSAEEFFPDNKEQEEKIDKFYQELLDQHSTSGRGYRAGDDAYRYARPNYIKSLKGNSKSGGTYSYAGFKQLVHISSGIVRYFLEASSLMFTDVTSKNSQDNINSIPPAIQNKIIRQYSDKFLFEEFDKLSDEDGQVGISPIGTMEKMRNLVHALGGMFHAILLSDAAERRVFSIALSDRPEKEVLEVLKLGVRYGYIQESAIGNKEGTGRTKLYILSRRLSPSFLLDPTSFAGYKFITNNMLKLAMYKPKTFVGMVENNLRSSSLDEFLDTINMFDTEEL